MSQSNTSFTHDYTVNPANQSGSTYPLWFFGDPGLPVDNSLAPVTDGGTTYYYRQDPHRQEMTDAHVLMLPVVRAAAGNPPGTVTVVAFAAFYAEQPYSNRANNAIALGRFIGMIAPGTGGGCAGAGDKTPPRLVQ